MMCYLWVLLVSLTVFGGVCTQDNTYTGPNVHYHYYHAQECSSNGTKPGQRGAAHHMQNQMAALEKKLEAMQKQVPTVCQNHTKQTHSAFEELRQHVSTILGKLQSMQEMQMKYASELARLESRLEANENSTKTEYSAVLALAKSCQDIKNRRLGSGYYTIDPDGAAGVSPFMVKCNMTHDPAMTIIEHNYPTKTEVRRGSPVTYSISYRNVTKAQLVSLTQWMNCTQFLRFDCYGSLISNGNSMVTYWTDRDGTKMNYWSGGHNFGCACGVTKTCAGGRTHHCECEKNDNAWRHDEGSITDARKLPVNGLYFGDIDDGNEQGRFTLEPLKCC